MGLNLGRKISRDFFKSARKYRKTEGGLFLTRKKKENIISSTKRAKQNFEMKRIKAEIFFDNFKRKRGSIYKWILKVLLRLLNSFLLQ